jgi:HD superfamily phosphohydrolase YqeK
MTGAVADEIFGKAFPSSEARQEFCLRVARAALIALRDNGVTEGMLATTALCHDTVECCFRNLLDAAIDEG